MIKFKSILLLSFAVITLSSSARSEFVVNWNIPDSTKIIEKVYLHTDRDFYSPGDDIWFKAYLTEASDMILSDHSRNLHVELISPGSGIIDSRVIRMENGLGNGDFRLSDSISSGSYLIRSYTNYMRNFNDRQFFTKEIIVVGSSDSSKLISDSVEYQTDKLEVRFFPEGGSLINDITSVVAFKAVNALGSGCDVEGELYTTSGERVTSFRSTYRGMGKFFMRPVEGLDYFAIVTNSDGDTVRCSIPESFSFGMILNVSDPQNENPQITVRTNPGTLPLVLDQDLSLTISVRKKILKVLNFKINSLFTSFRLPTEDLPNGIIQLTLSGPGELPLCERLIFHSNENFNIELKTDKPVYHKRDSVSVTIMFPGDSIIVNKAFLSLSAAEEIYLYDESRSHSTISSWFLLESDIRGPVEDPSYYFDSVNPERIKNLDLLLCTQGWRDFEWKYKNPEFLPENGFSVSGRVKKLFSREPLINSVVTSILKTYDNEIIATSSTDSAGMFRFEEFDFTGNARLIASATGEKEKFQGQLILDSLMYIPEKLLVNEYRTKLISDKNPITDEKFATLKHEYEIKNSIKRKYTLSDTILLGEVEILSSQKKQQKVNYAIQRVTVGIPHNIIEMTPKLENRMDIRDVIRGRVANVTFIPVNDPEMSGIRLRGSRYEPLFMLDGVVITYGMLSNFPLAWIERIEILKPGGLATTLSPPLNNDPRYSGLISVITKPVEDRKVDQKKVFHSVNKIITGYNAPRIFYSPDHSSGSESVKIPDLRSTLFWEPNIIVENDEDYVLRYFNADNPSAIIIIAEGMTSSGIPVTGRLEYVIE
jgi:ribosomal protein S26